MAGASRILPLLLFLIFGAVTSSHKTYEVTNIRSIRSSYVDKSPALTLQEVIHGEIKERHKRLAPAAAGVAAAAAGGGGGAGGAAAAAGWTGKLSSALNVAGQFAGIVGSVAQVFTVVQGFKQLALQREQLKIQQRQFEAEMNLKTIDLCARICVTNWSPWAPCNARCGGGTSKRRRQKFESNVCKGKPCPHHLEEMGICNPGCANNGLPSGAGTCDCPRGFNGPCCNNEIICDFPGKPRHGQVEGTIPAKFGGVISYACSDGFALVGDENRVCRANSQWDGTQPMCDKITCSEPEEPFRGTNLNKKGIYQYGEEVFYRCNNGYVLTGPEKRQCITYNGGSEGLWSGFTPLCLPVDCHDPGYPLHGYAQGTEFTLGNKVTFSCRKGFRLIGSESRECRASGTWSGHEARCELITCEEPLIPKDGRIRRPRENYRFGIQIHYQCQEGYVLEGNSTSWCVEDAELSHLGPGGKWSSAPPICRPTKCGDPGMVDNGAKDGSLYYFPNNVTYLCFDGYVLQGASMVHCGYNGVWSSPAPTCLACPANTYRANSDKRNECIPCPENTHTATEASSNEQQCVCNLGWTGPPGGPCTEIECPPLTAPENGVVVSCDGNKYNDKCIFKCHVGYILDKGSSRRTCQDTTEWTGTDAQCSACPLNTFKSDERSCLPCPLHSSTIGIASTLDQCTCDEGYEGPAGGPCVDTNECLANDGHGPCDDVCRNTPGSYVCECSIPGWVIDEEVDRHICKLDKSCRNLTQVDAPDHGGLVCHWYLEENSQQCSVRCNPGYEFPARTNNFETCGPTTGYKWTHEEREEVIEPCIEEFFPEFRLEGNSSYFVRNCRDLTPDEQEQVKKDFAQMLTDEGVCVRRATKVCDAKNVGIICGATKRRRKRGVTEDVDEVNVFFEFAANQMPPSKCNQICRLLRIPMRRCDALCVPTYKRFMKALMKHTKRSLENLFNAQKTNFRSGQRMFEYHPGTLETSDVIIDCPPGMVNDETCVPCAPGTFYSPDDNKCKGCAEHTYQANPQQNSCVECPLGTYAPKKGSPFCNRCPKDKWGEKCQGTCHCEHGQCDSTNGRCLCYSGWEGPECNIDTQSCTADSCHPGVKCHDIPAPGTGFRCDPCPSGFQGDGSICVQYRQRRSLQSRSQVEKDIIKTSSLTGLSFGSLP